MSPSQVPASSAKTVMDARARRRNNFRYGLEHIGERFIEVPSNSARFETGTAVRGWLTRGNNNDTALGIISILVWSIAIHQMFRKQNRRKLWWDALLVTVLFISGSICSAMELYSAQRAWIDYRNLPGNPLGFFLHSENAPHRKARPVALNIAVLAGDGLLGSQRFLLHEIFELPLLAISDLASIHNMGQ
jgi:hypothetical protein